MTARAAGFAAWDGVLRARLAVLGLALFVYLTAELFPVGPLVELAEGLRVRPAEAGLLLTAYAVAAGAATLPAVWWSRRLDRRLVLAGSLALLAVSLVGFGFAPSFTVAALWRAVAAVAHGVLWSQVPVVAARYAPPGQRGRATAAVFVGSSLGLVAGAPLATALTQATDWRQASLVLAAVAAATALLLRALLPPTPVVRQRPAPGGPGIAWRPVLTACLATVVLVVGHYVSYGYLALLIAPAGLAGTWLAPVLAGYGVAGLLVLAVVGRHLDTRPRAVGLAIAVALTVAVAALGLARGAGVTLVLVLLWGAAAAALPVILQTAVLRAARGASDLPSAAYVVAYQIGISAGSALGAALLDHSGAAHLPLCSAVALVAGTVLIAANPRTFGQR